MAGGRYHPEMCDRAVLTGKAFALSRAPGFALDRALRGVDPDRRMWDAIEQLTQLDAMITRLEAAVAGADDRP